MRSIIHKNMKNMRFEIEAPHQTNTQVNTHDKAFPAQNSNVLKSIKILEKTSFSFFLSSSKGVPLSGESILAFYAKHKLVFKGILTKLLQNTGSFVPDLKMPPGFTDQNIYSAYKKFSPGPKFGHFWIFGQKII